MTHAALTPGQAGFDQSFEARLAKVDLRAVMAHLSAETGLKGDDLARAEQLYRQFLTLKARYPQTNFVPPKLVDEVWHTHITFTRQYFADCELLFGEYLHHNPGVDNAEREFEDVTVPAFMREFKFDLKSYGLTSQAADCSD